MSEALDVLIAEAEALAGGPHRCNRLGHAWVLVGGRWCGCEDGSCSVPVYKCSGCGDYDYGDNEEALEIRADCAATGAADDR